MHFSLEESYLTDCVHINLISHCHFDQMIKRHHIFFQKDTIYLFICWLMCSCHLFHNRPSMLKESIKSTNILSVFQSDIQRFQHCVIIFLPPERHLTDTPAEQCIKISLYVLIKACLDHVTNYSINHFLTDWVCTELSLIDMLIPSSNVYFNLNR